MDLGDGLSRLVGNLSVPETLCILRRRHRLSQHDVAVATNIPASTISNIERGVEQSPDLVDAIRRFFADRYGEQDAGDLSVAEALFILRRRRSLTQEKVEKQTGVPHTVLCMMERENRPISKKHMQALINFYAQHSGGD